MFAERLVRFVGTRISLMEDPVRLAIIWCGGMRRCHLAGLAELVHTSHMNCSLVAVCDPNQRNAEDLADDRQKIRAAFKERDLTRSRRTRAWPDWRGLRRPLRSRTSTAVYCPRRATTRTA